MDYFNTEKRQKKERKTKLIKNGHYGSNSHNHLFSRRGIIGIKSAFLYSFSPSLPIKHLTMIHELFLFLGGPKCYYDSCLDQNGGAGLKTCHGRVSDFWKTDTVKSCGSLSDICANVCD
jgi:hypothetical protein